MHWQLYKVNLYGEYLPIKENTGKKRVKLKSFRTGTGTIGILVSPALMKINAAVNIGEELP
jgi:hypothetical protein